jgi:hypothetical protein
VLSPQLADPATRYHVVVVDKRRDKPALEAALRALGAGVARAGAGGLLLEASLTRAQLVQVARLDQVLWVDRVTAIGHDMDNARVQGGAAHVEVQGSYTGQGIQGHVFEGVETTHPDFTTPPVNVLSSGEAHSHGHCTAGIVFGNGKSTAGARGMAPDAKPFYTSHLSMSGTRWEVVRSLVGTYEAMFTTASWGHAPTTYYTSISADADDIVFDHDIPWTQSQANTSGRESRPEAWAKNVFSIGAVAHRDNANPADDSWRAGGGSTGPTADGRIKPDLVGYYDSILCSDMVGSAGYDPGSFYASFGGTSGATAICAGSNALAIQMFTDGLFGPKRKPNGTRWENRPHSTTLKALQIANASQYSFTTPSTDNRREQVGWGFPSLQAMYDRRGLHYVVDETDVVLQGEGMTYRIAVAQGQPELRICLSYADPAGNPSATRARVNDLTLRVTAPSTAMYWGNVGLSDGNYSQPGGERNSVDTVECVFVQNPAPGIWEVEVGAFLIAQDGHVETPVVDADYGLVVVGGSLASKGRVSIPVGGFVTFGGGCPTGPGCRPVVSHNWTQTSANRTTTAQGMALMEWTDDVTTICGADLYMGPRSGAVDVKVSLCDYDTTAGLPGRVRASETIRVGSLTTHAVRFRVPTWYDRGAIYFIVFDNADKLILPVSTSGEFRFHLEMRGSVWNPTFYADTRWQYRVQGIAGNTVPVLSGSGTPAIGKTFQMELANARASTPGVMLLGASDTQWGAITLPWRYATTCELQVSGDLFFPFLTTAVGTTAVPLPVPNDKGLVGLVVFQQFVVRDATNPVGWIVSNGGRLKIGEY